MSNYERIMKETKTDSLASCIRWKRNARRAKQQDDFPFPKWIVISVKCRKGNYILRAQFANEVSFRYSPRFSPLLATHLFFGIVVIVILAHLLHGIVFNLLHFEVSIGRVASDRQEDRSSQSRANCNWCSFISASTCTQRSTWKFGGELVVLKLERL